MKKLSCLLVSILLTLYSSAQTDASFRDVLAGREDGVSGAYFFGNFSSDRYLYWNGTNYLLGGGPGLSHAILHSGNYHNYAPSLTGAGASGTWAINTSGSANLWGGYSNQFNTGIQATGDFSAIPMLAANGIYYNVSPSGVRSFLGLPSGGETWQTVTDRGNIINGDNKFLLLNRSETNRFLGFQWQTNGDNDFFIGQRETGDRDFHIYNYGTASTGLIVKRNTGNIGIGTMDPGYKLDVAGSGRFGEHAIIGTNIQQGFYQDAGNGAYRSKNSGANGFYFQNFAGAMTSMFVGLDGPYAGKIGIGTVAPQSELAVKGTITSMKVKVSQEGWADYVFDSSYRLASLKQVETFIQKNKHLPDVPSAAEVKKDGLDLGDNQAALLKKIEELTLYIIEQNKRLEMQDKRLNVLESKAKE